MSGGRIYGVVSDGSVDPLARISELETSWPIIQAKLSAYDGLISEVQNIKNELITIKSKHEELKDDLNSVDDNAKESVEYAQSRINFHVQALTDSQKSILEITSGHKGLISQFRDNLQEVKDSLESVKAKVEQGLEGAASKVSLQDHKDQSNNALSVVKDVIGDLGSKFAEVKAGLAVVKSGFQNQGENESVILGTIKEMQDRVIGLVNSYESYKTYVSTLVYNETKKVSDGIDSKMKDLKASSSPAMAVNALREEFVKKMEGVALDGTNAVLRSANATTQIGLLEKKIENILLRLKAIELPKA